MDLPPDDTLHCPHTPVLSVANPCIDSQLDVLRRICDRGLVYGVTQHETYVVDLFQHMKDEVLRLRHMLAQRPDREIPFSSDYASPLPTLFSSSLLSQDNDA